MKHIGIVLWLMLVCTRINSQFYTVIDSLDDPIALEFVEDDLYVCLHGQHPNTGKVVKFTINSPESTAEILFDSMEYPRTIVEQDSVLFIGTPSNILTCDLRKSPLTLDTFLNESFSFPRSFAFYNEKMFIAENKKISQIDLNVREGEKRVLYYFEENILSFAMWDSYLYIATGNLIYKLDMIRLQFELLPYEFDEKIYSLVVINDFLYISQGVYSSEYKDIHVISLSKPNDPFEVFCTAPSVIGMVHHNGSIYFASQKPKFDGKPEGKILRIDKPLKYNTEIESLKLFPNPTTGRIKLSAYDFSNYKISIYTRNGHLVSRLDKPENIDISGLASGLYLLKVDDLLAQRSKYFKVVKVD